MAARTRSRRDPQRPPVHPGAILRDDVLPALGLTTAEAAGRLGVTRQHLHRVLAETAPVSVEMALRLDRFCGGGAETWLRMQMARDLWQASRDKKAELARIEPAA